MEYQYNGIRRLASVDYSNLGASGPRVRRQMFSGTDNYDGWDRFGRTVGQQWEKYGSGAGIRDQFDYTYDYASNRLTRANALQTSLSQAYTYDGLHRLKSSDEQTASNDRHWTYDQLGNWEAVYNNLAGTGTAMQTRSHNSANELGTISDSVDPVHDAAGNMTRIPKKISGSFTAKYDAWNRLVELTDGSDTHTNQYDGLNRRIVRISPTETRHFYYNRQWQVLEERVGGAMDKQYVYHPHYVDAIAMMRNAAGEEFYYLQDANFNVTSVVDDQGTVKERYTYTPYGEVTVLNGFNDGDGAEWSPDPDNKSDIGNEYLYTGRRLDPETGLQLNRNRFYASHLGRWVNRDPIRYLGGLNLYGYVGGMPTFFEDPFGLAAWLFPWEPGASWNPIDTARLWFGHSPSEHLDGLYTGDTNPSQDTADAAYGASGDLLANQSIGIGISGDFLIHPLIVDLEVDVLECRFNPITGEYAGSFLGGR